MSVAKNYVIGDYIQILKSYGEWFQGYPTPTTAWNQNNDKTIAQSTQGTGIGWKRTTASYMPDEAYVPVYYIDNADLEGYADNLSWNQFKTLWNAGKVKKSIAVAQKVANYGMRVTQTSDDTRRFFFFGNKMFAAACSRIAKLNITYENCAATTAKMSFGSSGNAFDAINGIVTGFCTYNRFIVKANEGYHMAKEGFTLQVVGSETPAVGWNYKQTITVSKDETQLQAILKPIWDVKIPTWDECINFDFSNKVEINITFRATPNGGELPIHPITVVKSNCTVTAPTQYTNGEQISASATPNTGYEFATPPSFTYTTANGETVTQNFIMNGEGGAAFTGTIEAAEDTSEITLTATAIPIPQRYPVTVIKEHCIVTGIPAAGWEKGTDLSVVITADTGYYFTTAPYLIYNGVGGQTATVNIPYDSTQHTASRVIKFPSVTADNPFFRIYATAVPETEYKDKYGAINVYQVTTNQLAEFAKQRFIRAQSDDPVTEIDLGKYVTKLFRFYADVGETSQTGMNVGNYSLPINVEAPVADTVVIECGTVTVTGHNNSANDYNDKLEIMLPFIGLVGVDIDYTMGHTLHLFYRANIVTGEAVAFLEVDEKVVQMWDCNISQDMLYLAHTQETFSNLEYKSKFLYGFIPYLLHTYKSESVDANLSNAVNNRLRVGDITSGYFEMIETTPFTAPNMNQKERDLIIQLLREGVFRGQEYPGLPETTE